MDAHPVSTRAKSAGSSRSRAIAKACRAGSNMPELSTQELITALSAVALAQSAGATSRLSAASSHASPSEMRPRPSQNGCSVEASSRAAVASLFSSDHANAARMLSNSSSDCAMRLS